jgi:glycosyltransferase involved in cell wall biosynthesis
LLSLIIPVYKNEANLSRLVRELSSFAAVFPAELEIVFVVDGSPDACHAKLRSLLPSASFRSQLLELSRNFGSFSAIRAGLEAACGTYFAVVAADLQEPLSLVSEFYRVLDCEDVDIAFGVRARREDARSIRWSSELFWRLYRRFVIRDMPRGGIDVFACNQRVRDQLLEFREADTNLIALLFWVGFKRKFVPYERQPRLEGESAWTFGKRLRYAIDSIFNFSDLPLQVLMAVGLGGMFVAVAASVIVFTAWLAGQIPVLGYTPLMLEIAFFGGSTALGLGVIGQYLWLNLQNSRRRPTFIVRTSESFDGESITKTHAARKLSSENES